MPVGDAVQAAARERYDVIKGQAGLHPAGEAPIAIPLAECQPLAFADRSCTAKLLCPSVSGNRGGHLRVFSAVAHHALLEQVWVAVVRSPSHRPRSFRICRIPRPLFCTNRFGVLGAFGAHPGKDRVRIRPVRRLPLLGMASAAPGRQSGRGASLPRECLGRLHDLATRAPLLGDRPTHHHLPWARLAAVATQVIRTLSDAYTRATRSQ